MATRTLDYQKIEEDLERMKKNRRLIKRLSLRINDIRRNDLLTLADVARENRMSRQYLSILIRRGKIKYKQTND